MSQPGFWAGFVDLSPQIQAAQFPGSHARRPEGSARRQGSAGPPIGRTAGASCCWRRLAHQSHKNGSEPQEKAPPCMRRRGLPRSSGPAAASSCSAPLPPDQLPSRYPPEVPVAQFPLRPGCPPVVPFSAVRDFYACGQGPRKGFWRAISRSFRCPQLVHSSAAVIPAQTRIFHSESTGRPPGTVTALPGRQRRAAWSSPGRLVIPGCLVIPGLPAPTRPRARLRGTRARAAPPSRRHRRPRRPA